MNAAILNAGSGAWAFEELAQSLSHAFGVSISDAPAAYNYLLAWESKAPPDAPCFVPFASIEVATDKRLIERAFAHFAVPRPTTFLLDDAELDPFLKREAARRWLLKYPTGCGGAGHRFAQPGEWQADLPDDWPRPFVVQEFIELARPEVFRLYGVAGELFGANARRFAGEAPSVFVAHARGARYEAVGDLPNEAFLVARLALEATGLWESFGCVDLLRDGRGRWLALEVGTDGLWNHVDRDIGDLGIAQDLETRLARAFRAWAGFEALVAPLWVCPCAAKNPGRERRARPLVAVSRARRSRPRFLESQELQPPANRSPSVLSAPLIISALACMSFCMTDFIRAPMRGISKA